MRFYKVWWFYGSCLYKNVKDEKKAEELYKAVEEFIKENEITIENKFKEEKIIIKNELKDELRKELATKDDILLVEERLRGEMKAMKEEILRYVDNRFNQLDKKMTVGFVILILLYILTNPNAIELIKLLFNLK